MRRSLINGIYPQPNGCHVQYRHCGALTFWNIPVRIWFRVDRCGIDLLHNASGGRLSVPMSEALWKHGARSAEAMKAMRLIRELGRWLDEGQH